MSVEPPVLAKPDSALLWGLLTDKRTTPDERRALHRMRRRGIPDGKRAWVTGIANRSLNARSA